MDAPLAGVQSLLLGHDPSGLIRTGLKDAVSIALPHEMPQVLSAAACYFFAAGGTSEAATLIDAVAQGPVLRGARSVAVQGAKVLARVLGGEPAPWFEQVSDGERYARLPVDNWHGTPLPDEPIEHLSGVPLYRSALSRARSNKDFEVTIRAMQRFLDEESPGWLSENAHITVLLCQCWSGAIDRDPTLLADHVRAVGHLQLLSFPWFARRILSTDALKPLFGLDADELADAWAAVQDAYGRWSQGVTRRSSGWTTRRVGGDLPGALAHMERVMGRQGALVELLRPGLDEAALTTAEAQLGFPLPAGVRALYRWHNGAKEPPLEWNDKEPPDPLPVLPSAYGFPSFDELVQFHRDDAGGLDRRWEVPVGCLPEEGVDIGRTPDYFTLCMVWPHVDHPLGYVRHVDGEDGSLYFEGPFEALIAHAIELWEAGSILHGAPRSSNSVLDLSSGFPSPVDDDQPASSIMAVDLLGRRRRGMVELSRLPAQIRTVLNAAKGEGDGGATWSYIASRLYDLSMIACPAGRDAYADPLSEPTWEPFVDVIVDAWALVGVDAAGTLRDTEFWTLHPCLPPSSQGRRVNAAINEAVDRLQH